MSINVVEAVTTMVAPILADLSPEMVKKLDVTILPAKTQ